MTSWNFEFHCSKSDVIHPLCVVKSQLVDRNYPSLINKNACTTMFPLLKVTFRLSINSKKSHCFTKISSFRLAIHGKLLIVSFIPSSRLSSTTEYLKNVGQTGKFLARVPRWKWSFGWLYRLKCNHQDKSKLQQKHHLLQKKSWPWRLDVDLQLRA